MKILKFGGTSVGTAESIRNVKEILEQSPGEKIVVVSAMAGVTNLLVSLAETAYAGNRGKAFSILEQIREKHNGLIEDLLKEDVAETASRELQIIFDGLRSIIEEDFTSDTYSRIITSGEKMLSLIFSIFLAQEGLENDLLNSADFMHVDNVENPEIDQVGNKLQKILRELHSGTYIAQGFIRVDNQGSIGTLKRGGSDYTATIIAAAVNASEVQIWTDIDGFHNNDPRFVEHTHPLEDLTFEEAAELAYFGAKILHPQTVSPVKDKDIPIFLKNTFTPSAPGTRISSRVLRKGLKAISAKDGITAIKIKSNRMLMAHGFLKKIFEIFDKHETAIDMITTSEIAISLTIDDEKNLPAILEELKSYGQISVDREHSIICIVGEGVIDDRETFRLFEILNDLPVRMISYGGSQNNISLLVDQQNKIKALRLLNQKLFEEKTLLKT